MKNKEKDREQSSLYLSRLYAKLVALMLYTLNKINIQVFCFFVTCMFKDKSILNSLCAPRSVLDLDF